MNLSKIHAISFIFAVFVLIGGLFVLSNHKIEALSLDGIAGVWVTTGGEGSGCTEEPLFGGFIGKDQEVARTMSVCETGGGSGGSTPPPEPIPPTPEPPIYVSPNSATGSVTVVVRDECSSDVYSSDKYCLIKLGENSCTAYLQWRVDSCGTSTFLASTPVNKIVSTEKEKIIPNYKIEYPSRSFYFYKNNQPAHSIKIEAKCATGSDWNGSICAEPMTGTLRPVDSSCMIKKGASSCNVNLTWTVANPPAGTKTAITASGMTDYISPSVSGGGPTAFSIPFGLRKFFLYNNGKELATASARAGCEAGAVWSGITNKCVVDPGDDPIDPQNRIALTAEYINMFTKNGVWTPSPDGIAFAVQAPDMNTEAYRVTQCNKHYSAIVSTKEYKKEKISGWLERWLQGEPKTFVQQSYACYKEGERPGGDFISVALSANPTGPLTALGSTNLSWTTTGNPDSCDASGVEWTGTNIKNGDPVTQRSGMSAKTYVFEITCHKAGLSDVKSSVSVVVNSGDDGDLCPDVPGIQTTLPCTGGGTDLCPDVPGIQTTLPCTGGGTDLCPDVPGIQTTLPCVVVDVCPAPLTQIVPVACDPKNGVGAISGSVLRSQIKRASPLCDFETPITVDNSKYESDTCVYPCLPGNFWDPLIKECRNPVVSFSTRDCRIELGKNNCLSSVDWSININKKFDITTPDHVLVANQDNPIGEKSWTIEYPSRNFYLYEEGNTEPLFIRTANAACKDGTKWNSSENKCVTDPNWNNCGNGSTNPPDCDNGGGGGGGTSTWSSYLSGPCIGGYQSVTRQCSALPGKYCKGRDGANYSDTEKETWSQTCNTGDGTEGVTPILKIKLTAIPDRILKGKATTLTWISEANSCVGSGFPTGNKSNGSAIVSPKETTTYGITCTNGTDTESTSTPVKVNIINIIES